MPEIRTAAIVIVGDEILAGEVVDRNGPHLLAVLTRAGTRVVGLRVVGDGREAIAAAVREGLAGAGWVVVTGGIGPTHDDATRPAVAEALGVPLLAHPEARRRLETLFGGEASEAEIAMADLPAGSEILTAPGLRAFGFRTGNVVVFPGVPALLEPLLEAQFALFAGVPLVSRSVPAQVREGRLAAPLAELAAAWPHVRWGSYPDLGPEGWSLRIVLRGEDPDLLERAEQALYAMLRSLDG